MKEVETWHSFMETLSSWLALQEEAFVRELQLCIPVKSEIKQVDLNAETAARSSKLFYYLTQSLAKWDRGLELLRSCSKRQGQSACLRLRGDSDYHLSVQYRLEDGGCLRARTGAEVVSAREPFEEAH